jgi:penicillin-binding protein 1A
MDPHTGRILAMQGGYAYDNSEFNRATQAKRQPGSAFKPFVYLTAVEQGFTASNLILDAPIVIDQGGNLGKWRPANYSNDFDGLMPMRVGLEKSKNLMTVRLADHLGMDKIADTAHRFNIFDDMPPVLSMALGSGETTLIRMANAYAMLVNGGKRITPSLIDRIQNRNGQVIYRHDDRQCTNCGDLIAWAGQDAPRLPDARERITDPRHAYQIINMLEGVVQRGTGRSVRDLNRPVGGKTGTTNDSRDTWFIGFTPDLVVAAYVGYDQPKSLGEKATGASVAAPIFEDFMRDALADQPAAPFRMPSNLRLVRVNAQTGEVGGASDPNAIWTPFIPGSEPGSDMIVLDTKGVTNLPTTNGGNDSDAATLSGTGGFY